MVTGEDVVHEGCADRLINGKSHRGFESRDEAVGRGRIGSLILGVGPDASLEN